MGLKLLANKYIELNIQGIEELIGEEYVDENDVKNHIFIFCRLGNLVIAIDDKDYCLKENEVIYISSKRRIKIRKGNYSCILVQFNGSAVEELICNSLFETDKKVIKDNDSHIGYYFYKMFHAYREKCELNIRCLGILYELFYELTKQNNHVIEIRSIKEKHINVAKDFINENYNKEISISDVAREVGVTCNYLSNLFSIYEKTTPKEYLIYVRMEQAKKLLLTEKYKVKEVSLLVGYKNQLHFSSEFRKYTSYSPLQYIKVNLNKKS